MSERPCYHCGLPVPETADFAVIINGERQPIILIGKIGS